MVSWPTFCTKQTQTLSIRTPFVLCSSRTHKYTRSYMRYIDLREVLRNSKLLLAVRVWKVWEPEAMNEKELRYCDTVRNKKKRRLDSRVGVKVLKTHSRQVVIGAGSEAATLCSVVVAPFLSPLLSPCCNLCPSYTAGQDLFLMK